MSIKVEIEPVFLPDQSVGSLNVEVEGKTIGECLKNLVEKEPYLNSKIFEKDGRQSSAVVIALNHFALYVKAFDKEVKDGDVISLHDGGGG